jgi:hypothetical protein
MRAATRTGFVFAGQHAATPKSPKNDFVPHITAPDLAAIGIRKEFRAALLALSERLEALRQAAEDAGELGEAQFWQAGIERLKRGRIGE